MSELFQIINDTNFMAKLKFFYSSKFNDKRLGNLGLVSHDPKHENTINAFTFYLKIKPNFYYSTKKFFFIENIPQMSQRLCSFCRGNNVTKTTCCIRTSAN